MAEQLPAPPPRKPDLPIIHLLPNLLTIMAICAGLTAIRFGIGGDFERAVQFILIACVLDGLDGRFARMLKSESALGAELDSLADFLNFGVAAPLVIYLWTLRDAGGFGWIVVLIFAACAAVRLARFNVSSRLPDRPSRSQFFVGVPAPMGAALVLAPLFIALMSDGETVLPDAVVVIHIVIVGLLMISRIPTPSAKGVTITREKSRYALVAAVIVVGALLAYTWTTLVIIDMVYALSIIWAWRENRKLGKTQAD
ncbi:MAG: CDP-diacylglycerol--serine O-phosphatidyltransferase [Paracoccaceae bacterium]